MANTPTADFTRNADWTFPLGSMEGAIAAAAGLDNVAFVDATRLANGLMGDAIAHSQFGNVEQRMGLTFRAIPDANNLLATAYTS